VGLTDTPIHTGAAPREVVAYVALGANLGDAQATVLQAMAGLSDLPGTRVLSTSPLYRTAPFEATGPDFVNAVAAVVTRLSAPALLSALQGMEAGQGRLRPFKNAPRTLDLDILLYGSGTIDSPTLKVPHPRMAERAFVLVPLFDIAPELVSPEQLAAVQAQSITRLEIHRVP